ncbi:unnamed protein product, partial [Mesorhabditis spiculigera]
MTIQDDPPAATDPVADFRGVRIRGRWKMLSLIGDGTFGSVYSVHDKKLNCDVAMKLGHNHIKKTHNLKEETDVYRRIQNGPGMTKMLWHGTAATYDVLVMEQLGPCLHELLNYCGHFSHRTTGMLAVQIFDAIEFLHSKGFIHCDIKPTNFAMGTGENFHRCFLFDFGLAARYLDDEDIHREYSEYNQVIGTNAFASVSCHLGLQLSRRDDIESLAYMFIYFAKGTLPWLAYREQTKTQTHEKVFLKKTGPQNLEKLCTGLPPAYKHLLVDARELMYTEKPDYKGYKRLFQELWLIQNRESGLHYDWMYKREVETLVREMPPPTPKSSPPVFQQTSLNLSIGQPS